MEKLWIFAACVAGLAGGCGEDHFLIVTVDARPAVHDIAQIEVELTNAGTSRGDTFDVTSTLPATFSVSTSGRTGDLSISITARDEAGLVVGIGTGQTSLESAEASVTIDSADFVVNTDFADDQFPSSDFESIGFQVGAGSDGTWTSVFRDNCNDPCNMFARRFDVTGKPVESGLAAGTNAFAISTTLSDGFFTSPATATSGTTTVAVWNFSDAPPSTDNGIACRAIDASGNGIGNQITLETDTTLPFAVDVAPFGSRFAVSWEETSASEIHTTTVNAQCQPGAITTVSTTAGNASRPAVAANGNSILYAWRIDGNARFRIADANNIPQGPTDQLLVGKTATDEVEFVRVAPLGDGFAAAVRWTAISGTGPGKIELYRISSTGMKQSGLPTLITAKSGSDFNSAQGFAIGQRDEDGAVLVAWHACDANGDGSGCGVFGRIVRPTGVPVGSEFLLATTTDLDQTDPSVVGLPGGAFAATWRDDSGKDPDKAGSAVRARVLYPIYDDAKGVLGATCGGSAACDDGLSCQPASEGGLRCFAVCDPSGPAPQCPEGGTCSQTTTGAACLF